MALSADFLAYVLEQLAALGDVSARRMFGGAGLYSAEYFFGLIADDVCYLRVDDSNRADFLARAAAPFRPYAHRPQLSLSYYAVPADVLEDARELVNWARRSLVVAMQAGVKTPRRNAPAASMRRRRRTVTGR